MHLSHPRLACTLEMLESGRRSLKQGDITGALNDLAECCEVLAEEHGEDSEKCAEVTDIILVLDYF